MRLSKRKMRIILINQALFGDDQIEQLKALINLAKENDQDLGWLLEAVLKEREIIVLRRKDV